ncbi:MAG TPA: TOBE domain-containing protein [Thermoplasmata archaeon]|nr:TOBE domain-containing protein [Thermoplasmata archaeon]
MHRTSLVTNSDVALLRSLARERSLVRASREVGMTRDRAVYRISRLARAFGGPVVRSVRGGAGHGGTVLTALGDRIVRGGFESVELLDARPVAPLDRPNLLHGIYRRGPVPTVQIGREFSVRVAFDAEDGTPVSVLLDPEAVVVARRRFPSSARNVLSGTVEGIRRERGPLSETLVVRCSATRLRVAITEEPVRQLGLRPGVAVWLYVKATALRRVGAGAPATRGSPRS